MIMFFSFSLNAQHKQRTKIVDKCEFRLVPPLPGYKSVQSVIRNDFLLTLRDGIRLDCSKFYPDTLNPYFPDGFPVVVMCHGYAEGKESLENFASEQARYGYAVYIYSMRGQSKSEGRSNLISTIEAEDLKEFINYVKKDNEPRIDSNKILIMGGSQGGIIPFMASCRGLKINSLISALNSPEFASSWIENGCVKMTYLWSTEYSENLVRYAPQVDRMSDWIYASGLVSDKWDSIAYYLPLDRDFTDIVGLNSNPILLENSWQDYFFNTKGNINNLTNLNSFHKIYFGAVNGHGGDTSHSENMWHMNFFDEWFYYFLWGINPDYIKSPQYHYAYTSYPLINNMWSFIHDSTYVWPPAKLGNLRLYLKSNNTISGVADTNLNSFKSFTNNVKTNYTLQQAVNDEFTGTNFSSNFKVASIYFETAVLKKDIKMIGTPKINLDYQASGDICQYNFQIFEVRPNGTKNFVSRINYTDRKYTANQRKSKSFDGNSMAHIFKAGNKIRIVITNLDRDVKDAAFLETNPFVLPVMKYSVNRIYLKNTSIDLPVIGATNDNIVFQFDGIQNNFILNQNYPNPFNPATKISFLLPENFYGFVTLKIYDITGREIKVLLNTMMNSGKHFVNFDGSSIAGGVYFYKLTAENYSEVKKMILIK